MPKRPKTYRPPGAEAARATTRRQYDRQRGSTPQRRLLWKAHYLKFRIWLLQQRPLCQDCNRASAVEVHHTRKLELHPEDLVDQEHCLCLCHECHSVRTRRGE